MAPVDLDDHVHNAIAAFERERVDKWDDPVKGEQINDLADKIAALLFDSATTLLTTVDQEVWRSAEARIAEQFQLHDELLEALQLRVAQHYFLGALPMARRTLELLKLTLRISPKEQVRRFLVGAARSHILELNAECAVMCRAAIENALGEKYERCKTPWPINEKGASPFPLRVDRAVELGWLPPDEGKKAKEVWTRGSKSAHADPTVVTKRWETLSHACSVLESLYA